MANDLFEKTQKKLKGVCNPLVIFTQEGMSPVASFYSPRPQRVVWVRLSSGPHPLSLWDLFLGIAMYLDDECFCAWIDNAFLSSRESREKAVLNYLSHMTLSVPCMLVIENAKLLHWETRDIMRKLLQENPVGNLKFVMLTDLEVEVWQDGIVERCFRIDPEFILTRKDIEIALLSQQKMFEQAEVRCLHKVTRGVFAHVDRLMELLADEEILTKQIILKAAREVLQGA